MSERLSTGCAPLDELLEGGLERGATTQVYGPPASGKTNVALSAAIETAAGGGSSLYVDTEGLSPDRMQHLLGARAAGSEASPEAVAERVVVADAMDFADQEEAVQDAADLASRVELVVLDSATGFYRLERDPEGEGEALRRVGRQLTHLLSLARKHDLAVLFTNQVFTDPETEQTKGLGGHTLNHWSGAIVRLDRFRGGNRRATLEKHRSLPAGESVQFRITDAGIQGTTGR